jgi:hypothetical protein
MRGWLILVLFVVLIGFTEIRIRNNWLALQPYLAARDARLTALEQLTHRQPERRKWTVRRNWWFRPVHMESPGR